MQVSQHRKPESEVLALRRELGRWLKQMREESNLSQRQLADLLGIEYYTFISQLETGRGRIPPERYVDWASSFGMTPRDFVMVLLRHYEPSTFSSLFPDEEQTNVVQLKS